MNGRLHITDRARRSAALLLLLLAIVSGLAGTISAQDAAKPAVLLEIGGPIGPATSDHVVRGLAKAQEMGAVVAILRLDTPGGLDTSMREIVRAILASPVPVVSFVAPSGARAASAGTYIVYASHVAAMAPGTNLGAATPIQIGAPGLPGGGEPKGDDKRRPGEKPDDRGAPAERQPGMAEKAVNDAVAYIRSLAQMRGRNVEWAEKSVRQAASLSAEEALKEKVIDLVAPDVPALMRKLDGREVTLADRSVKLATAQAAVVPIEADWRTKLLAVITDPNVASLLMLIGVYALIFEFYSPGMIGPGVVGAICILLALYAFHVLPVDYTGLALLLLGIGLMVAEAFIGAFGALGIGGLVAFVMGSIMLMREDVPGFRVAWELVGSVALFFGVTFLLVTAYVMRSRHRPIVAGREQMIDSIGHVLEWHGGQGSVRAHGELWQARSPSPLRRGQQVRVKRIDGLTLEVEPEEKKQQQQRN
jgi:membrane-bound serine protease (ClpP class)